MSEQNTAIYVGTQLHLAMERAGLHLLPPRRLNLNAVQRRRVRRGLDRAREVAGLHPLWLKPTHLDDPDYGKGYLDCAFGLSEAVAKETGHPTATEIRIAVERMEERINNLYRYSGSTFVPFPKTGTTAAQPEPEKVKKH